MNETKDPKPQRFKFSVDNKAFESEQSQLTGAQVKALAQIDPTFGLFLEGRGKDPDQPVVDGDTVDLSQPGREQFYTVPPATYGRKQ